MWPLQQVGPHRGSVPPNRREMRLVCGGTHDEGAPVPYGGVPGQEGPLVSTHRGQVRELQGPSLRAGERLPEEEGGPRRREGVEVPSPTWRQRGKTSPPEEPPTDAQETPRGGMEVEEEYEPASEEAMEEYGPRGGSDGRGVGWRGVLAAPHTLPQARVTFLFSRVFLFGGWWPYYGRLGRSGARETDL